MDAAFVVGSVRGNLLVSGVLAFGFALLLVLRHSRMLQQKRSEPN